MSRHVRSLFVALLVSGAMVLGLPLSSMVQPAQAGTAQARGAGGTKGNPSTKVWVNTRSHVYHCPGTRYYGNTKNGEYMTQADAQKQGNRPAYGKYCN